MADRIETGSEDGLCGGGGKGEKRLVEGLALPPSRVRGHEGPTLMSGRGVESQMTEGHT